MRSARTTSGRCQPHVILTLWPNAAGSALVYSTFLGGSSVDQGEGFAVDSAGNAYVTGETDSPNFPTTPEAFRTAYNGGLDTFVPKLAPPGCPDEDEDEVLGRPASLDEACEAGAREATSRPPVARYGRA